jgi:hypothetical protein
MAQTVVNSLILTTAPSGWIVAVETASIAVDPFDRREPLIRRKCIEPVHNLGGFRLPRLAGCEF